MNGQDNFSKQMCFFTRYWRFQLVQIHKWEHLKFQSEQIDEMLYLSIALKEIDIHLNNSFFKYVLCLYFQFSLAFMNKFIKIRFCRSVNQKPMQE